MKTIMLVDDSPIISTSIEMILRKASYQTQTLASAEEALTLLAAGAKPDLIVTDLNMGAMSGIDLIREARKLPALRFVPILVLTIETRQAKRREAKEVGASGWLIKPIESAELLEVLQQLLPSEPA